MIQQFIAQLRAIFRSKKPVDQLRYAVGNAEEAARLLDEIMLTDGVFNYEMAMVRLSSMKDAGDISTLEYLNLVDACNCRQRNGHYGRSLIYKRAQG